MLLTTTFSIAYKDLKIEYDVTEIYTLVKEVNNIDFASNVAIFQLLKETSYLETTYNQVQEKADNLEPDVAAKFLSY